MRGTPRRRSTAWQRWPYTASAQASGPSRRAQAIGLVRAPSNFDAGDAGAFVLGDEEGIDRFGRVEHLVGRRLRAFVFEPRRSARIDPQLGVAHSRSQEALARVVSEQYAHGLPASLARPVSPLPTVRVLVVEVSEVLARS